jgi:hypothetical protein
MSLLTKVIKKASANLIRFVVGALRVTRRELIRGAGVGVFRSVSEVGARRKRQACPCSVGMCAQVLIGNAPSVWRDILAKPWISFDLLAASVSRWALFQKQICAACLILLNGFKDGGEGRNRTDA